MKWGEGFVFPELLKLNLIYVKIFVIVCSVFITYLSSHEQISLTHIVPSLQLQLIFWYFICFNEYWKIFFWKKGVRIYGRFSTCQFKLGCVRVNTNRKKVKYICKEWHFSQIYIRSEEDISIFHLSIIFIRNIFNWSLEILCSIGRIMNRERKENGTLLFCI